MQIFRTLLIIVGLAVLASPVPALAKDMSVEKVIKKTKLSKDESDGVLDFKGPKINFLKHDPYYVRSFVDAENGATVHFVIVEYDFIKAKGDGDSSIVQTAESLYKNFYTAVDLSGAEFELEVFHKDFEGCGSNSFCSFEEYFRITIPDTYFREMSSKGITLRARSESQGSLEIYLYPAYVQGILQRIQKEREARGIN